MGNKEAPLPTVGLFAIGLDTYWPQFHGLREKLLAHHGRVAEHATAAGCRLVDAGLVDSVEKAGEAVRRFAAEDLDLVLLFVSTYALSSTVLPVVQRLGVPVLVLNLQPVAQLDYAKFNALGDRGLMTGVWLEHCQACSVPEIACVFNRAGIDHHILTGHFGEVAVWEELADWIRAAGVAKGMRENRLGVLGHYYCGMLDVYTDLTMQSAVFGTHIELLEMCELHEHREAATQQAIDEKMGQFREFFDVSPDCELEELRRAARTSVALDRMVMQHKLGSLAYYYEGTGAYQDIATSVIPGNTLLTGGNVPVAGECEVKNAQAMKIMDLLGAGGSFSEFYLSDFEEDILFLGHDGPAHPRIAEGRVGLVPLPIYHGKPGKGLSIQMSVKHGPVTLLSVVQRRDGGLVLQCAQGHSVAGPVLQIGNTNSRYRFPMGIREFINAWSMGGPSHHCAIGVGHLAGTIQKIGALLGIEVRQVC